MFALKIKNVFSRKKVTTVVVNLPYICPSILLADVAITLSICFTPGNT